MNLIRSPRVVRAAFALFLLFTLIGFTTTETSARGRHSRGRAARRVARGGRVHLSKREMRAERSRLAHEEAAYMAKLERRAGHKLSKRERAAEMRKFSSRHRREIEEARRRAEAARLAAIARQRALDEGMRNEVQANIAKDSTVGEDLEVRK